MKILLLLCSFSFSMAIMAETSTTIEVSMSDVIPLSYREDGVYKGFNYEILKQLETHSELKFNYTLYPHARLSKTLPNTNTDLIIFFKKSCRKFSEDFEIGAPLYISPPTIFLKKGIKYSENLRIGRINGTCIDVMDQNIKKEFQIDVSTIDQALQMLNNNRIDGICGTKHVLKASLNKTKLNNILTFYKSDKNTVDFTAVICMKKSLPEKIKLKIKQSAKKIKLPAIFQ